MNIKIKAPTCLQCQKSNKVVCVIKWYEWYCKRCKLGWMGAE